MSKTIKWFLSLSLIMMLAVVSIPASSAADPENSGKTVQSGPTLHDGKKWRIGYAETDPYGNFAGTLNGLVRGLARIGWLTGVEDLPYETGQADSRSMWQWLASRDTGPYIEFVGDAHYSFIDGEEKVEQQINDRLTNKDDIDLMIVMGTLAGTKVATELHNVPTLVFSSSNAVNSGIIQSVEDSGYDHIWAHMDPDRYTRQVQVFHDIFEFGTLGMVYENSELGKVYAAVDDVKRFAGERGVQLEARYVNEPKSDAEYDRYYAELKAAFTDLADQVDAMYLTFGVWDLARLPELLQPFYDNKIPVFSQLGPEEVTSGALLSLARPNFDGVGLFGADTIGKILNGVLPRELLQVYGETPSIVLNMAVADRIGYQIPFDILLAADEIMTNIANAQ